MYKKICCIYADNPGGYCKNKKIKRSLLGFGARTCKIYFENNYCKFQIKPKRPRTVEKFNSTKGKSMKNNLDLVKFANNVVICRPNKGNFQISQKKVIIDGYAIIPIEMYEKLKANQK